MINERDETVAREELIAAVSALTCRPEWAASFAQRCLHEFRVEELPELPPGHLGFLVPRYRWVVRDEDLRLVDSLFASASAVVGTNVLVGSEAATAVVGVVAAVFTLFRAAYRKGAMLSEQETTLLVALKGIGSPNTVDALVAYLNGEHGNASESEWTTERVKDLLESLERTRLQDGSVVALVERDGRGMWGIAGI